MNVKINRVLICILLTSGGSLACHKNSPQLNLPSSTSLHASSSTPPSSPIPVLPSESERSLLEYVGSEAEALKINHDQRISHNIWLDQIAFQGHNLDISAYPHDTEPSYGINSPALARELQEYLGSPFNIGDIISLYEIRNITNNALREEIQDEIIAVPPSVNVVDVGMQPCYRIFMPRVFPAEKQARIAAISQRLNDEIARIALPVPNADAYARVSTPGMYDTATFQAMLVAIEHNNEGQFIHNLAQFAGSFGSDHSGAKNAFFESFITLFVTKQFPSKGLRDVYFHFCLRCGQIHT